MQTNGWVATAPEFSTLRPGQIVASLGSVSRHEARRYSLCRAILAAGDPAAFAGCLERELSDAITATVGRTSAGIYVPTRIMAGLDTKTGGAGGFNVGVQMLDLIDMLRNRLMVAQLGATILAGLRDNLSFPVQLTGSTGSWVSQNPGVDVPDSDATFGQKTMTPHTYQVSTAFSRQFLAQSSTDAEALVRNDLIVEHARAVDLAVLNGTGLQNQPLGLLKTTGIGSVAIGDNGGAPTYDSIVDLETAVANANGDAPGEKFLTTPIMRGKMRKTQDFPTASAGRPLWESGTAPGEGIVAGYPAFVSKQVPAGLTKGNNSDCHAIIFGFWPSILIGEWGVIELIVDPYRLKKQGMIEVTSFQMVDILVRQPAQFAAIQDARNA